MFEQKTMDTELKKNISKIKKLLKQRDYVVIDMGIQLAQSLNEPEIFEVLLGGWSIEEHDIVYHYSPYKNNYGFSKNAFSRIKSINGEPFEVYKEWLCTGKLVFDNEYKGESLTKKVSSKSWPYYSYALWNLIGCSNNNSKLKINFNKIEALIIDCNRSWERLPILSNFKNINSLIIRNCKYIVDINGISECKNISHLDLASSSSLKSLDGIENLKQLKTINLGSCSSLENLDAMKDLVGIKASLPGVDYGESGDWKKSTLDLSGCSALKNLDGLKNLIHVKEVHLGFCSLLKMETIKKLFPNRVSEGDDIYSKTY